MRHDLPHVATTIRGMKLVNIKSLESALPRIPPLSDCTRFAAFVCLRCSQDFLLDMRVYDSTVFKMAHALGVDYLACPHCDARDCTTL
jgi:DNA-directed RNA polymerase subunit RPC12/RpoP